MWVNWSIPYVEESGEYLINCFTHCQITAGNFNNQLFNENAEWSCPLQAKLEMEMTPVRRSSGISLAPPSIFVLNFEILYFFHSRKLYTLLVYSQINSHCIRRGCSVILSMHIFSFFYFICSIIVKIKLDF